MQRSILAFRLQLALALLPTAVGAAPQADSGPLPDRQVNSQADPCVRLRAGASLDQRVLGCLEPGTRLRLLGAISGWSHVRLLDGAEGWIDSAFLEMAPGASGGSPTPAGEADVLADLRRQIEALEGQLKAAADRRMATEERLRRTVEAAEAAQNEASRLRQQLQQTAVAAPSSAASARPESELAAARARLRELEQAVAGADQRLRRAAALNAEQERRIESLDAAIAAARGRETDLSRSLAQAEARAREAGQQAAAQAARPAEREGDQPAARDRETELRQQLAAAERRIAELEAAAPPTPTPRRSALRRQLAETEARLRDAESDRDEQARRIEELERRLADAQRRAAEAELRSRLAGSPETSDSPAAGDPVSVRAPVVTAPEPPAAAEPPKVSVRPPAALESRQPAARPEPPPGPVEEVSPIDAAIETVRAWAAAWSDQRLEDYLSYYAPDFRPAEGLARGAWEEQRRRRLGRPSYIRVTLSGIRVESAGEGAMRVTFRQEYESDTFADSVTKVLTLVERDGGWRILTERVTP